MESNEQNNLTHKVETDRLKGTENRLMAVREEGTGGWVRRVKGLLPMTLKLKSF